MTLSTDPLSPARCTSTRRSCSPRHRKHCNTDHVQLVQGYRDAREALRESTSALVPAAYAYGADVAPHQLEDADFDAAFPRVTFKDWLVGQAGRNRQPEPFGVSA